MATGVVKGVKGRQGYLYNDGVYWVLRLFGYICIKSSANPMAISPIELKDRFKIRRHSPQWDNPPAADKSGSVYR